MDVLQDQVASQMISQHKEPGLGKEKGKDGKIISRSKRVLTLIQSTQRATQDH